MRIDPIFVREAKRLIGWHQMEVVRVNIQDVSRASVSHHGLIEPRAMVVFYDLFINICSVVVKNGARLLSLGKVFALKADGIVHRIQ